MASEIIMRGKSESVICEVEDGSAKCNVFDQSGDKGLVLSMSHARSQDRKPDDVFNVDRIEADNVSAVVDKSDDKLMLSPYNKEEEEQKKQLEQAVEERRENLRK